MICKENMTTLGTNDKHHTFIGALTIILINQPKQSLTKCTEPHFDYTTRILQLPLCQGIIRLNKFKNKFNLKKKKKTEASDNTHRTSGNNQSRVH